MTCNIDSRGRVARLIYGLILLATGILLAIFLAYPTGGWLEWLVAALLAAAGAFAVFEAWAGWCVMRAMGFRTPI